MKDFLERHEVEGQDNWRVTESNEYGENESLLFATLEEALTFMKNHIVDGNSAGELELAFIVPFSAHVTIEV